MKPITLPGIDEYAERHTTPAASALLAVAAETYATKSVPQMLCGQLVGSLLQMLVHALRPRLVVDVGTFSGYSALTMASALPADGRLVTCEIDPAHAETARRHIEAGPHADQITLRVGPALESLRALPGPFDLVFIDADKPSYPDYFEAALEKLSDHGLIVCDNTLWNGEVLDPHPADADASALRAFNASVVADPRVHCVLLTARDGVTLIRRT